MVPRDGSVMAGGHFERAFRSKLQRMYRKTHDRQQRAPVATTKAEAKRQRRAAKRRGVVV